MSHHTACILCSLNCGLEVDVADGHLLHIRGDRAHPMSQGYTCQKALRLDYYQNGRSRVTTPLRRKADGAFEEISWDTAIAEIAAKAKTIRDAHGGDAFAYYGGGGQGNHLGGAHSTSLRGRWARGAEKSAATKLKNAAHTTASLGDKTRVETTVAMLLAAS